MKIHFITVACAGVALGLLQGCAPTETVKEQRHEVLIDMIKMEQTVLSSHKLPSSEDEIFITRDSTNRFWKLRMFPLQHAATDPLGWVSIQENSYSVETLYEFDPTIGVCYAGRQQVVIPCEKLKADKDMGKYIP